MFERTKAFFRWLTGKNKKVDTVSKVAYRLKKGEKAPDEFCVCVFDGKTLVEVSDQVSAENARKNFTCWAVLRESFEVTLGFNGQEAPAKILLEPALGLGNLFEGREILTLEAVQSIVQSQFAGLTGLMQGSVGDPEKLDATDLAACCAKLNLLLAVNGLKCLEIGSFTAAKKTAAPVTTQEVESELNEALKPVRSAADWNSFSQNIQAQGFPMAWDSEEMSELGKKYLENRITSEDCVSNIRRIAEEAAQAAKDAGQTDYWDGLAIRLRLESEFHPEPDPEDGKQAAPLNLELGRSLRPKKGWFTQYVTLDQKLQEYLKNKMNFVQSVLESERATASNVKIATEIRFLLSEMESVQQLLKSAPVLDARTASLQVGKKTPTEMVKIMNQAVTAAEYLEAAVKSPEVFRTYPLPQELKKALSELRIQLEARYRTR